jgi:hypothetical protein
MTLEQNGLPKPSRRLDHGRARVSQNRAGIRVQQPGELAHMRRQQELLLRKICPPFVQTRKRVQTVGVHDHRFAELEQRFGNAWRWSGAAHTESDRMRCAPTADAEKRRDQIPRIVVFAEPGTDDERGAPGGLFLDRIHQPGTGGRQFAIREQRETGLRDEWRD